MRPQKKRHGKWAPMRFGTTWRGYRYGSSPRPAPGPILSGKHRENAVQGILTRLRRWRLSPFEREGECRAGVRQSLCLAGHGWEAADTEAASLVADALHRLGAKRPSWEAGQWQHSHPREDCYRCGGLLDPEDRERGFRYCSELCAKATRQHFSDELPWDHELMRRGYWQLVIANSPTYTCEVCGDRFKSWREGPRYCSRACAGKAKLTQEQPCAWCGTMFRPQNERVLCCSQSCGGQYRVAQYREKLAPELTCPHCRVVFRPSSPNAVYCSKSCQRAVKYKRDNPPKPPQRVTCEVCQTVFEAGKHNAKFCSKACSDARKLEQNRAAYHRRRQREAGAFREAAE